MFTRNLAVVAAHTEEEDRRSKRGRSPEAAEQEREPSGDTFGELREVFLCVRLASCGLHAICIRVA